MLRPILGLVAASLFPTGCARPHPPEPTPVEAAAGGDAEKPSRPAGPAFCWLAFGPEGTKRVLVTYDGRSIRLEDRSAGAVEANMFPVLADCKGVAFADADGRTGYVVREVVDMGFVEDLGRGLAIDVEITGPVSYWQGAQVRLNANADQAPVVHFHAPLTVGPYAAAKASTDRRVEWNAPSGLRLTKGSSATTLNVQIQNRVSRPDCHVMVSSTDPTGQDSRFPADVRPVADVEFPPARPGGQPVRRRYVLDKVCCGSNFYGRVDVPDDAGAGVARVTLSFDAWDGGRVAPNTIEIPVVETGPADG